MRTSLLTSATIFLGLAAVAIAPVQAQEQQQQQQPQPRPVAQECLQRLEQINRELIQAGYGTAGPRGFGLGAPAAPAPAAPGTFAAIGTPRGEMRALMHAGHVLANHGYQEACQGVVAAIEDLRQRHGELMAATPAQEMDTWRQQYLAGALPVTELTTPVRIDRVIGADVRNMRDEDLGDVADVILDEQGRINYALVSRGGFLGFGQEYVPVRWEDMKITAAPYQDTLVLDVPQAAFENAPAIQDADADQIATAEWQQQVDQYWDQQLAAQQ